ncbi:MAG: arginyltransferase [Pseudomonadota bacterium]
MRSEDIQTNFGPAGSEFYITQPAPCPYLHGRTERKIFSFLDGSDASAVNGVLTRRGFRRSQNIIYVPACDTCQACVPVRVVASEFELSKSRRRIVKRNADISRTERPARATTEQYSVLRGYLDARHAEGGMADMTVLDYAAMVEETAVDTKIIEYRAPDPETGEPRLIACALTDHLADGLSMVYSFFDPDADARSLGVYMILDHVRAAQEAGLDYVYLGYWVAGSAKMDYKIRFQPLEKLTENGWRRWEPKAA